METVTRRVKPSRPGSYAPVLILSVTIDPEYNAVTELLPRLSAKRIPRTTSDSVSEIDRWSVVRNDGLPIEIATGYINGMGNARSAMETLIFLNRISPRYVFLCGIAGSLAPSKAGLGDVVIAKCVDWWNLNKVTKDSVKVKSDSDSKYLKIENHYFRKEISTVGQHTNNWNKRLSEYCVKNKLLLLSNTDRGLLQIKSKIQKHPQTARDNVMHYQKVISWEYVLSDATIRDHIRKDSGGGLAIEMEGAGFLASLRRRNEEVKNLQMRMEQEIPGEIEGFVFRGISDLSHNKGKEAQGWRKIAMFNAAGALTEFLRTFTDDDFIA